MPVQAASAAAAMTTESHNGTDAFTFEIRFSEEFPLSYKTLRDSYVGVIGSVVLPVTEDCAAQGAICTEDGRSLSNRLQMTVTGPLSADQNTEATGAPTISGTAQVDETLTADVSSFVEGHINANQAVDYARRTLAATLGSDVELAIETEPVAGPE